MTDPELGKVDRSFFDEHIASRLGAPRDDVVLGPTHGVDFGVVDVGETALVMATDPLSILPDLGLERAGRFAIDIVLADVAVSGLSPSHVALGLTLPPSMTDEAFATMWRGIDDELSDLGASIVTGHTARYQGCTFPWIGAATAMAVGSHADLVRPDGARPGDRLLVTNGPAVETAGLFASLFPSELALDGDVIQRAQERLDDAACVRDAVAAADAGTVHAMHDATEGGLQGALCELAESAGVRLDVDGASVPMRPGVEAVCDALDLDPWTCTSAGTLLLAVDPESVDAVEAAISARGTPVERIGTVRDGVGVYVDGDRVHPPDVDPSWQAFRELSRR
jgi:hydrogenase maturation factor